MNAKFWFEGHLTEECLIGLLDGEIDRLSAHKAEKHLKSCWTCRHRSEVLQQSMNRFIEFYEKFSAGPHAQPSRDWRDFDARLLRTAASLASHKKPNWRSRVARIIFAPAAAALSLGVVMWLTEPHQLSATEIYTRSAEAELQTLARVGGAVIVREFRVESGERTGHLAVWHAPFLKKTRSFWDASSDTSLQSEVQQIYSKAGLRMGELLSASNHARWENSLAHRRESVEQDKSLLRVITRNTDGPREGEIVQAELVLRSVDWHPVEERFKVGGRAGEEYRVIETGYRVETSDVELARMYAVLSGEKLHEGAQQPVSTAKAIEVGALLPGAPIEPAFNAPDAEVEALVVLHEIQADRQEAATVRREDSQVVVTVYVANNDDRRAFIERRLSTIPSLRLVFHSLSSQQETAPAPGSVTEVTAISAPPPNAVETRRPLFAKALSEQSGSLAAANDLVSHRLDLLANLGVELRAMERLAARFPEEARSNLVEASRRRLDGLASDYLDSARRTWNELEFSSGPFRIVMELSETKSAPGSALSSCGEWYRERNLASAASRLEDLFGRGFTTISGEPGGDFSVTKESIRSGIEQVSAELSHALAAGCLR
jgi:hypothetical protein